VKIAALLLAALFALLPLAAFAADTPEQSVERFRNEMLKNPPPGLDVSRCTIARVPDADKDFPVVSVECEQLPNRCYFKLHPAKEEFMVLGCEERNHRQPGPRVDTK
jgi:hypothetical protein